MKVKRVTAEILEKIPKEEAELFVRTILKIVKSEFSSKKPKPNRIEPNKEKKI